MAGTNIKTNTTTKTKTEANSKRIREAQKAATTSKDSACKFLRAAGIMSQKREQLSISYR